MKDKNITVEDLLMMTSVGITPHDAAIVMGLGYATFLKMIKNDTFPYKDCIIKRSDSRYMIMRVKLITYITGESYEEQLEHKKRLIKEKGIISNANELTKINKIIKNI